MVVIDDIKYILNGFRKSKININEASVLQDNPDIPRQVDKGGAFDGSLAARH